MAANQRARLCGAMVELVAERGYAGVTVRELTRLAGVSTRTFYDCFANVEECFATTHALIVGAALKRVSVVSGNDETRLRARMRHLFASIAADPNAAHLMLVEALSAGPSVTARVQETNRAIEQLIGDEFAARGQAPVHPALAHGIVSAALRVMRADVLDRQVGLPAAADRFSDWLLAVGDERILSVPGGSGGDSGQSDRSSAQEGLGSERRLLLEAVAKLSILNGYGNLTIPAIRREAGVPRRSFDEHFEGVEDCFLAAIEARLVRAAERAEREAAHAVGWERGVVRAVATVGASLARDPDFSRLAFIDILDPGRPGLELRERLIASWARRLFKVAPQELRPDDIKAETSVAAAWGMAEAWAAAGRSGRIQAEIPSMAFVVMAPAIGPEAAELAITAELGSTIRRTRKS